MTIWCSLDYAPLSEASMSDYIGSEDNMVCHFLNTDSLSMYGCLKPDRVTCFKMISILLCTNYTLGAQWGDLIRKP